MTTREWYVDTANSNNKRACPLGASLDRTLQPSFELPWEIFFFIASHYFNKTYMSFYGDREMFKHHNFTMALFFFLHNGGLSDWWVQRVEELVGQIASGSSCKLGCNGFKVFPGVSWGDQSKSTYFCRWQTQTVTRSVLQYHIMAPHRIRPYWVVEKHVLIQSTVMKQSFLCRPQELQLSISVFHDETNKKLIIDTPLDQLLHCS